MAWKKVGLILLIVFYEVWGSSIREPNCYSCFKNGPEYSYCKISKTEGVCCEAASTDADCNYNSNTSL